MAHTRRDFLKSSLRTLAGLTASGMLLSPFGCATGKFLQTDRRERRVLADLHVHAAINEWNRESPLGIKYPMIATLIEKFANKTGMDWKKCHAVGIDMICAAHFNVFDEWLSMPTDPNPQAPYNTHRMMDYLEELINGPVSPYARIARNSSALKAQLSISKSDPEYRIAVLHTIEGGHALGGDISTLESFADRGVAMITLTHFFNKGIASAVNAYPYFPDANSGWSHQGLSEFGRDVVMEMERLGIIVDVIHCTSTAIKDVLEIATKPLVASHASTRTLGDHPYSLFDEHIQQIASDGGIIGVIIDPFILCNYSSMHEAETKATLQDVVRTIQHIVKLCGNHKHVGIGSDFAGYISGPTDMSRLSQIGRLRYLLLKEFGSEQVVDDILANNAIEFLLKNWYSGVQKA